jgi:competence protein ComEA
MAQPPLLAEHPRPLRIALVFVLPVVFGAITGYFLGVSEGTYLVLSALGVLGGIGAGYDHVGAKAGAGRGLVAGFLFGATILIAHEIHGAEAEAHLPEPPAVLVVVITALGIACGAIGGWLRARSMRKHGIHPTQVREQAEAEEAARGPFVKPPLSPAPPRAAAGTMVDLNSGTSDEFRSLGMSVTQARRVIEFREQNGGYSSVDDLDRLVGFPRDFLAQTKQRLTV